MGVEFANEVDSPLEEAEGVVDAELEPVETFSVTGKGFGWIDVLPRLVAVAVPRLAERRV